MHRLECPVCQCNRGRASRNSRITCKVCWRGYCADGCYLSHRCLDTQWGQDTARARVREALASGCPDWAVPPADYVPDHSLLAGYKEAAYYAHCAQCKECPDYILKTCEHCNRAQCRNCILHHRVRAWDCVQAAHCWECQPAGDWWPRCDEVRATCYVCGEWAPTGARPIRFCGSCQLFYCAGECTKYHDCDDTTDESASDDGGAEPEPENSVQCLRPLPRRLEGWRGAKYKRQRVPVTDDDRVRIQSRVRATELYRRRERERRLARAARRAHAEE